LAELNFPDFTRTIRSDANLPAELYAVILF